MASKFWPKGGLAGILHHYNESLVAFEYTTDTVPKPHSIVFVGGLGDGLGSTSYTADLVYALQHTPWSLFTLNLSSSFQAWGLGDLDRDTNEIAQCVQYVSAYKASKALIAGGNRVVLMGHSTGSQDILHYLYRPNPCTSVPAFGRPLEHITRPAVDGAILQAPVSDRECIQWVLKTGFLGRTSVELREVYDRLVSMAEASVREAEKNGQSSRALDETLPIALTSQLGYLPDTPLSARRFLNLVSPRSPTHPSEDDLFSSDLSTAQLDNTFGMVAKRGLLRKSLLVLPSGADQAVPDWIDKAALLERWKTATNSSGREIWDAEFSGPVPNASHALSNDDQTEPRRVLNERVLGFLRKLDD